ncbi:hypothetical protein HNR02_004816 [Amycolatopsis endophytica]|uniref:Uncharacterized protein n=1 Tax=Amycolatopsis endophytica TaxID=860233 RepID=A0A853B851_9PSEU|nr:hypothetical protein [Amycolatopsis endophytica]
MSGANQVTPVGASGAVPVPAHDEVRALGQHARSVEVPDQRGILDRFLALGKLLGAGFPVHHPEWTRCSAKWR